MTTLSRITDLPTAIRNDYQVVAVLFDEDTRFASPKKTYHYKAPKDLAIAVGDKLLVEVTQGANAPVYKPVTVQNVASAAVTNVEATFSYKWVVGKLDDILAQLAANKAKDARIIQAVETLERAIQRVKLKDQLTLALAALPPEEAAELKEVLQLQ